MTFDEWFDKWTKDTPSWRTAKPVREGFRIAWNAAVAAERKVWMDAVTDEPELPGAMPDAMWDVLRADRDAATEAMRVAVRQTKGGILKRGMRSNVRVNLPATRAPQEER